MFFRKKSKPFIKFIPKTVGVKEYIPPIPARSLQPKWWKNLDINTLMKTLNNKPLCKGTIKRCPSIIDFLKTGYIIRAWSDILVDVKSREDISYKFADTRYQADIHMNSQFLDYVPEHAKEKYLFTFKLHTPWYIQTSPGYSVLFINPFFHFNEHFDIVSALEDTDIYHTANTFMLIKKTGEFLIERGDPLTLVVPFKREDFDFMVEDFDIKRLTDISSRQEFVAYSKFSSLPVYKKEQNKAKKCPFS